MPGRIWKRVGTALYGYGNGYKAVVYDDMAPIQVLVLRGDTLVKTTHLPTPKAAKMWAEKHYLKGAK